VKNTGNNDVVNCKKCYEYETQLKEAMDELNSIRMINELLQKELFTNATPRSTWRTEPNSNGNDVQPFESEPLEHSSKMCYSKIAAAGSKWFPVVTTSTKRRKHLWYQQGQLNNPTCIQITSHC